MRSTATTTRESRMRCENHKNQKAPVRTGTCPMSFSTLVVRGVLCVALLSYGLLYVQLGSVPAFHGEDDMAHGVPRSLSVCDPAEKDVAFPYDKSVQTQNTNCPTATKSGQSSLQCAFCHQNDWVRYLSKISQAIRDRFKDECSDLIVYSVAFGSDHKGIVSGSNRHGDTEDLLQRHGHCFFAFVGSNETRKIPTDLFQSTGLDGLFYLIPIPENLLPYKNHRRNTKLLKLYGGLHIFDFSNHIIWQDAKLQERNRVVMQGFRNYTRYVEQNLILPRACLSVRSMPLHETTLGASLVPAFPSHCEVLLSTDHRGRNITDSRQAIQRQCERYQQAQQELLQEKFRKGDSSTGRGGKKVRSVSLDSGLIDSAFIVWDMSRPECRSFNYELSCRWLAEIHCHGDRDQISFPHVVQSMGLIQWGHVVRPHETIYLDKLLFGNAATTTSNGGSDTNSTWEPRIHMGRCSCHWYSRTSMFACLSNVPGSHAGKRLAIVVAGTLQRYNLRATSQNLIRPLVERQHHEADIFLSLSVDSMPPFRSEWEYMKHLTRDPLFDVAERKSEPSRGLWQNFILYTMDRAGATPRWIRLEESFPDLALDPKIQGQRRKAQQKYPNDHDADQRFPIWDQRRSAIDRSANANRNIFTVFYTLKDLWAKVVETEKELGIPYDYILFLRDDAFFLKEFDLNRLLRGPTTDEETTPDAFVLSCDAVGMHPLEMNDHGGLYRREAASIYGNYFDKLFRDGLQENCSAQLNEDFRQGGLRGCNSEMLLRWILTKEHNLTIQGVGQALLPFQRGVHVEMGSENNGQGVVVPCFHKYCQSRQDPLIVDDIPFCRNLTF